MVEELPRAREPHEVEYGELPELTRALRALGSNRRHGGATQALFFRPLLEARRKAETARTPEARLRAFAATELLAGLAQSVDRIVAEWPDSREAARRAVRAQIAERTRAYESELDKLRSAADAVTAADESRRLAAWREWTAGLRATFHCADRTWLAIQSALSSLSGRTRR